MATFVATMALVSYSTVGMWMPLFLAQQHGWSTAEYGSFYIWWALFATTGFWAGGWMIDRLGRRVGFAVLLIEAAVFMTIWIFAHDKIALWLLGMAWSWGFIGVWGPVTAARDHRLVRRRVSADPADLAGDGRYYLVLQPRARTQGARRDQRMTYQSFGSDLTRTRLPISLLQSPRRK